MENLLVENEIFCDLDSIKLDLDSDLFDLSPFEFERAAATATGAGETEGEGTSASVGDPFADVKPTTENNGVDRRIGPNDDTKAFSSLSSLLSPPSTPVITPSSLQQPSWNLESLKSRSRSSDISSTSGGTTAVLGGPFDAQPPPPNKNIINHQDKNVIQQILDGLQHRQSPVASTASPKDNLVGASSDQHRRPVVVVSAIRDDNQKNSLPKFKLEMIKEVAAGSSSTTTGSSSPTIARTLVPESNLPIMLQKPLIAKDQKSGNLQLLPESIIHMDGKFLFLGDLLSASGLHKNLICNLDIRPTTSTTAIPSGSLTPPIYSASSVNFGQYSNDSNHQPLEQQQPRQSLCSTFDAKTAGIPPNNEHSSHGLVHKLLASPISQLNQQPWQTQQRQAAKAPSVGGAEAAAALFPIANHSALTNRKSGDDSKASSFAEVTSLENVFPNSFTANHYGNKSGFSSSMPSASSAGGGSNSNDSEGDIAAVKSSPENSLRSVITNNIIKSKQQQKSAAAASVVVVKTEAETSASVTAPIEYQFTIDKADSAAASIGIFMESSTTPARVKSESNGGRGAVSMPASPVSFGERDSFFDAFVKTDLDEIIPEPLDNDCIICGVAFQTQAALRDHIEEHRDHMSMIQSGGGQSASLIDSPPYSSNSSVVGSEESNNGTSSGCPSTADAAEFYVNASMPASPASSTSSLDQLFAATGSPVRGPGGVTTGALQSTNPTSFATQKKIDAGSTLASLLVSNISPLLSSMDAGAVGQRAKSGPSPSRQLSYPGHQRTTNNQAFGQNLLTGTNTVGGIANTNGTIQRSNNGFPVNMFQSSQQRQQPSANLSVGAAAAAKWKKTGITSGMGVSTLLGSVPGNALTSDQRQFFGCMVNGQPIMKLKSFEGVAKIGQKRKIPSTSVFSGMGISKSCPVSPAMKDMMMGGGNGGIGGGMEGIGGGMEGVFGSSVGMGGSGTGGLAGSDMMASHQGPKTKKCRRVYGLNQKNLWCTQCQWKKACARFKPPKQ